MMLFLPCALLAGRPGPEADEKTQGRDGQGDAGSLSE
jgi:hypothetical protein